MTRKQLRAALEAHKMREASRIAGERANRLSVINYPSTHNPYLVHKPVEDCYPGCFHSDEDVMRYQAEQRLLDTQEKARR